MRKIKIFLAYISILIAGVCGLLIINYSGHNHSHISEEGHSYNDLVTQLRNNTAEEFESRKDRKETFVEFIGEDGCGACEELLPSLIDLTNEMKIRHTIYYLDIGVEANSHIMKDYGIIGTPTLLFIQDGKIIDRLEGSAGEVNNHRFLLEQFENMDFS